MPPTHSVRPGELVNTRLEMIFLAVSYLELLIRVFGIVSANKAIKLTDGSSKAKAGLVLNIIGCVALAVFYILGIVTTALR